MPVVQLLDCTDKESVVSQVVLDVIMAESEHHAGDISSMGFPDKGLYIVVDEIADELSEVLIAGMDCMDHQ
jgi:hypothetical protein